MNKRILSLSLSLLCVLGWTKIAKAQTVSDFENLTLSPGTFWNGSAQTMGASFMSGNAIYPNLYDTAYGGYWKEGWAYSNMKDSTTAGYTNMYSARPASGVFNSDNYIIGQQNSIINLTGNAAGKVVYGLYVTNSTYDALSMKDGDAFAKKFGGISGSDPDWLKLAISGYSGGFPISDTVYFYLADFRFSNNSQDYIVTDWRWVDLTPLGNLDSLCFSLTSSDTGMYGMNTPPFYCIDNFTSADSPAGIERYAEPMLSIFPNPAAEYIHLFFPDDIADWQICDGMGQSVIKGTRNTGNSCTIDLSNFANGWYIVKAVSDKKVYTKRFVKTGR